VRFLQRRKARHAIRRTAQILGNEPFGKNGLGFAKTIFWERVRKTETNVFEIRRGFGFPPRRRVREECGAGVLDFGGGGFKEIKYQIW